MQAGEMDSSAKGRQFKRLGDHWGLVVVLEPNGSSGLLNHECDSVQEALPQRTSPSVTYTAGLCVMHVYVGAIVLPKYDRGMYKLDSYIPHILLPCIMVCHLE